MRREMDGYYVLDLLPDGDGFPRYSNYGAYEGLDRYSFRAQFLRDVEDDLGPELFDAAYENKLAPELADYGAALSARGERLARQHGLEPAPQPDRDDAGTESPGHRVDVLDSAARWCLFWARRGHGLEAWF